MIARGRKQAAGERVVTERRFDDAFGLFVRHAPMPLALIDASLRIVEASDAVCEIMGAEPHQIRGCAVTIFDIAAEHLIRALEGEAYVSPRFRIGDGPVLTAEVKPLADGQGGTGGLLVHLQDVTQRMADEAEIERLAFRDALTGLPNRALFQRRLDEAKRDAEDKGEAFGLVMVDVDYFKDVNDTLGHDTGDALLKALADNLSKSFRATDTVARLGGDEFAVLLREVATLEDLSRPIEYLRNLSATPVEFKGQSFRISTSIGAALHNDPDADPDHLLKNADIALYAAKEGGRNRAVLFEPAMRSELERRVELLRDVRYGITGGEFELFYQPIIDLQGGRVEGLEALMRWNHPEQGVLTPSSFMAAFEDQDLSLQLGDVALDGALKQMRAWIDQGVDFGRVAINVSTAQFRTGRLAQTVARKLEHWRVPAERLTIEVTENVYMGFGAEVVADTVRALHDTGVMIALDDFGTGYASLANLRQFPVDRLKIDKSFVQDSGEDDAVVRAVINLGSSMGMKVVAEGVESPEQLALLRQHGCDQVQGFHFARSMPAAEVPAFISRFGRRDAAA
jgi:diguanylate cyclase (GGDEF)-like protein/PAS domain S-box-containing protein